MGSSPSFPACLIVETIMKARYSDLQQAWRMLGWGPLVLGVIPDGQDHPDREPEIPLLPANALRPAGPTVHDQIRGKRVDAIRAVVEEWDGEAGVMAPRYESEDHQELAEMIAEKMDQWTMSPLTHWTFQSMDHGSGSS